MPSESQTWRDHVRPVLHAAGLDPVRIENAVSLGVPDVNYRDGWIELKYAAAWPRRPQTPLRLDHFTPEQRAWLRRRWRARGLAWLLLRVDREFLLFDGEVAADHVGLVSRQELYTRAARRSHCGFDPLLFLPHLTTPRTRPIEIR